MIFSTEINQVLDKRREVFLKEQQGEIQQFVDNIQATILEKELTYEEAKQVEFDKGTSYFVELFVYSNINFDELNLEEKGVKHIYKMEYADVIGLATIGDTSIKSHRDFYRITALVFALLCFFGLSVVMLYRELSYIKIIEKGITQITKGDFCYRIPIQGRNELTSLAVQINEMGKTISDNIQKERIEEQNKRTFITNMSHDLRTPLTSMIGYIDLLQKKLSAKHELYEYVAIAKRNGLRLETLINDLFLYNRLVSGDMTLQLQELNINLALSQILELYTENIEFQKEKEVRVIPMDFEKFHRIIDNLMSNAVTYGVKEQPIRVRSIMKNQWMQISIENVTTEDLAGKEALLKERMYTVSEDRTKGATGLGLAIVNELLNTMGANMEITCRNHRFKVVLEFPIYYDNEGNKNNNNHEMKNNHATNGTSC